MHGLSWSAEHVEEWSGYLDLPGGRHLYWHSYESRHKPEDSPVMLWLNGGPGCSRCLRLRPAVRGN
jgi:carboxypeptidase C (cathepsin A)